MRYPALAALVLFATPAAAEALRSEAVGLRFSVPRAWERVPAASDVRAAQFRVPRAGGDREDGELVLFHFGTAKGGGVRDTLERWYRRFTRPDGKAAREAAAVSTRTVAGLEVTVIDLAGTFTGQMGRRRPPAPRPGYRMLAAVVEGEGGPWFWRAIGPAATIAAAAADFDALLGSLAPHR